MVQALRSFKLWNKLRKYLGGSHGSNDNPKRKTKSSLGAPFWAQMIGLVFFVAVFSVGCYYLFISVFEGEDILQSRQLRNGMCSGTEDDDKDEDCPSGASHPALLIVYFFGVFYLFIGIAIVCDEFFVASLEQIGIYLDLSDDVCGATLMAAGGSAPELATSLIGTFKGSDVGFGTIVGSAVFNVLFVIACCVMSTPKELAPLELTGWPLARDCCFYSITLVAVAICFGASSPGKIEGWEAVFLFSLYLTYVVLMKFNDKLYLYFNPPGVIAPVPDSCSDSTEKLTNLERTTPLEESDVASGGGDSLLNKTDTATAHPHHHVINGVAGEHHKNQSVNICPSHFRAGFFHLITQETITDTSGVAILNKIKGDVKESFDALDKDKSGTIDIHELKELMAMLSHGVTGPQDITDEMVTPVMKALDLDNNGSIDFSEFTVWYVDSEERLRNETQIAWAKIDSDHSGIPLSNLEKLFTEMELVVTQERLDEIRLHFLENKPTKDRKITFDEFNEWYITSEFHQSKAHEAKCAAESAGGIWSDIYDFPKENMRGNIIYILLFPLTISLACTCGIKDVRIPGNERWAYYEFCISILWIGVYSYILVEWVTVIGLTLKIPVYVLGLTLLAGGTSVPDLLSSVVVAKAGKGDMAVSSSIGSNIFDVTVGLPIPWLLFNLVYDCPVVVGADNLVISISVLLCMVLFVIGAIIASGWAMDYKLGATMMILYVVFLAQDISRIYIKGHVGC